VCLGFARDKGLVVGLDRSGESNIGGGVFVPTIKFSVIWQIAQFDQRSPHLLGRALNYAAATNREQCIAYKGNLLSVKPVGDMAECMTRRFDNIGGQRADLHFVSFTRCLVDGWNL